MFFFFNDTATTEIYTLSLHDALPIYLAQTGHILRCKNRPGNVHDSKQAVAFLREVINGLRARFGRRLDRKSTRLNSSHLVISYAVFCLKKKKHTCYDEFWL